MISEVTPTDGTAGRLELRLKDGIGDTAAPVESIEHGYTVGAGDNRLAVQREGHRAKPSGGPPRWRIAVGPIMAAAGEQPHSLAVRHRSTSAPQNGDASIGIGRLTLRLARVYPAEPGA
jgi:hypothetical protein